MGRGVGTVQGVQQKVRGDRISQQVDPAVRDAHYHAVQNLRGVQKVSGAHCLYILIIVVNISMT